MQSAKRGAPCVCEAFELASERDQYAHSPRSAHGAAALHARLYQTCAGPRPEAAGTAFSLSRLAGPRIKAGSV